MNPRPSEQDGRPDLSAGIPVTNWDTITYTYDPAGRCIKKNVNGSYMVKYVYDGDHVIAEYDNINLLRKYIYGARVERKTEIRRQKTER